MLHPKRRRVTRTAEELKSLEVKAQADADKRGEEVFAKHKFIFQELEKTIAGDPRVAARVKGAFDQYKNGLEAKVRAGKLSLEEANALLSGEEGKAVQNEAWKMANELHDPKRGNMTKYITGLIEADLKGAK